MTKDNSTGKNKDFYDLGKKKFDQIRVLPEHQAMIQRPRIEEDDDIQDYKKPWVDLNDSQIENIYNEVLKVHRGAAMPYGQVVFGRAVQARLKELNT